VTLALTNQPPAPLAGDAFDKLLWQGWFQELVRNLQAAGGAIDANTTWIGAPTLPQYLVANLPSTTTEGQLAYATDGRKVGEGAGAGTGVPVYWSAAQWRVFSTDLAVAA
jgi:hypothetical protein